MAIERESSEEDNSSGAAGDQLLSIAHGTGSTHNKKRKKHNKSHRDDE
jgi:hypothetical protein